MIIQNSEQNYRSENFFPTIYLSQFLSFIGKQSGDKMTEQENLLYLAYSLPKKIYSIIQLTSTEFNKKDYSTILSEVQTMVFSNSQVQQLMNCLKKQMEAQMTSNQVGDRKTSFFRTITRFLKKGRKSKKHEMANQNEDDFLDQFQKKLSANTISSADIKKLDAKFNQEITQYLNSADVIRDFLLVNKSKTNKSFYMLHMKEIGIASKNGELSTYSFYANKEFQKRIKLLMKTFIDQVFLRVPTTSQKFEEEYLQPTSFVDGIKPFGSSNSNKKDQFESEMMNEDFDGDDIDDFCFDGNSIQQHYDL